MNWFKVNMKVAVFVCWTFFFLFIVFEHSQAQNKDFIFQKGKYKFDIPFEYRNDFIVVNIYFNDVFPLRFIFDTGAEHTILVKKEITDLFQIDYTRKFTLYGADMQTQLFAYLAPGVSLRANRIKAINRSILVLDEDYLNFEKLTGVSIHGILGADFFRRFVVKIDYRKQKLTLYDPTHFNLTKKKYTKIPIEIKKNKPYLQSDIQLNKDDDVKVKLLLDTGASLALMLYTTTHPDLRLPDKILKTNIGMGLGGFIEGYIGRVESFKIDDFDIGDVATNYQEFVPNIDSSYLNSRNGLLGNLILKRFEVIIDYVNGYLYLSPNKNFKEKFSYDKSGLVIAAGGANLKDFSILKVIEDTPADIAGVKKGDRIIAMNGWPASFLSLGNILKTLKRKPGKNIKLKLERNGQVLKLRFELKELI